MKKLANRVLSIGLISVMLALTTACNTWPTIVATAQAMASVTTIFYPQVVAYSALSVNLLQQAAVTYKAYKANRNAGTAAAYAAAIQAVLTQLPADLTALNIPEPDKQKVTAVVTIILDFVEAEAGQIPASATVVAQARLSRGASGAPKRMTRAQIVSRWDNEVCHGDASCEALLAR